MVKVDDVILDVLRAGDDVADQARVGRRRDRRPRLRPRARMPARGRSCRRRKYAARRATRRADRGRAARSSIPRNIVLELHASLTAPPSTVASMRKCPSMRVTGQSRCVSSYLPRRLETVADDADDAVRRRTRRRSRRDDAERRFDRRSSACRIPGRSVSGDRTAYPRRRSRARSTRCSRVRRRWASSFRRSSAPPHSCGGFPAPCSPSCRDTSPCGAPRRPTPRRIRRRRNARGARTSRGSTRRTRTAGGPARRSRHLAEGEEVHERRRDVHAVRGTAGQIDHLRIRERSRHAGTPRWDWASPRAIRRKTRRRRRYDRRGVAQTSRAMSSAERPPIVQ